MLIVKKREKGVVIETNCSGLPERSINPVI